MNLKKSGLGDWVKITTDILLLAFDISKCLVIKLVLNAFLWLDIR